MLGLIYIISAVYKNDMHETRTESARRGIHLRDGGRTRMFLPIPRTWVLFRNRERCMLLRVNLFVLIEKTFGVKSTLG